MDDRYIMSGSYDGSVSSIDLEKRERIHTFQRVHTSNLIEFILITTKK